MSRLVVLSRTHTAIEAYCLKGRLESEHIPVFLFDTNHIQIYWSLGLALGGIRIVIPEEYLDDALHIMELYHSNQLSLETDAVCCEKCGCCDVITSEFWNRLGFILFAGLGLIFFFQKDAVYHCSSCKHKWRIDISSGYHPLAIIFAFLLPLTIIFTLTVPLKNAFCDKARIEKTFYTDGRAETRYVSICNYSYP